jgi:hypothetical protein
MHRDDPRYEELARSEALVDGVLLAVRALAFAGLVVWAHRSPSGVQILTGALFGDCAGFALGLALFWREATLRALGDVALYLLVLQFGLLGAPIPPGDMNESVAVTGLAFLAVFALRAGALVRRRMIDE